MISPAKEAELLALAKRRSAQQAIQKKLRPTFERIAYEHTPKEITPKFVDAWSYPPRSAVFKMRGIRTCDSCKGSGYAWVALKGDAFGFIRCPDCSRAMVADREVHPMLR